MKYQKPILIFNVVIPVVLLLLVLIGVSAFKSKIARSFTERDQAFQETQSINARMEALEQEISTYKNENMKKWDTLFTGEISSQVTGTVKNILKDIPSSKLQQTGFRVNPKSSSFAVDASQPTSIVNLSFSGRFSDMQKAIAEFETRLPHFQLDGMQVAPSDGSNGHLNYDLTYTVWKKN